MDQKHLTLDSVFHPNFCFRDTLDHVIALKVPIGIDFLGW